ncbi:cold-shock protein [Pseudomonas khavaziana]|uniref:cold-shock protein n=1 Tax=Pseudomonas khavaziana TaxID=2842351 RepID=UPI001C3E3790|nr:cold-shock protein [Pseudomonas khavaziana]MBV4480849.1 cold-shock protein [Pseudomonas khavaziana]
MAMGTVKFYNATKGFGFITPDNGGAEVFVHVSAVKNSGLGELSEGQKVQYDLEKGVSEKDSAVNLQRVS